MTTEIRRYANHREYDEHTYTAFGQRYTAEGWSETQRLFRFRGPDPSNISREGLIKLASVLRNGSATTLEHGDEHVEDVQ